jgi:hypothetical protein
MTHCWLALRSTRYMNPCGTPGYTFNVVATLAVIQSAYTFHRGLVSGAKGVDIPRLLEFLFIKHPLVSQQVSSSDVEMRRRE